MQSNMESSNMFAESDALAENVITLNTVCSNPNEIKFTSSQLNAREPPTILVPIHSTDVICLEASATEKNEIEIEEDVLGEPFLEDDVMWKEESLNSRPLPHIILQADEEPQINESSEVISEDEKPLSEFVSSPRRSTRHLGSIKTKPPDQNKIIERRRGRSGLKTLKEENKKETSKIINNNINNKSTAQKEEKYRKPRFKREVIDESKRFENDLDQIKSDNFLEDEILTDKLCRICLSNKTLHDLFEIEEDTLPIAEKVMQICDDVKILPKDQFPQYICEACLQSLQVALNFIALCKSTNLKLQNCLERKEKRINCKKPKTSLIVNYNLSDEQKVKLNTDDQDFQLSDDIEYNENISDSDSSYKYGKKYKTKRSTRRKTRKRRNSKFKKNDEDLLTNQNELNSQEKENSVTNLNDFNQISNIEGNSIQVLPPKKRPSNIDSEDLSASDSKKKHHKCIFCSETFTTAQELRDHKKTHDVERPFICNICSKTFRLVGSYKSHLQRHHADDGLKCEKCERHFQTKFERRRHMLDEHGEPLTAIECNKCKRKFVTESRLERHKINKCPGFEMKPSKRFRSEDDYIHLGKDLFKCVAPLTTTYWSDSFSD